MQTRLIRWLIDKCDEHNLSWSEASRRAGLSPNTISQIANGIQPGTRRLVALADYFDAPPEMLFRMAGILPPISDDDGTDAELRATMEQLHAIWRRLKQKNPDAARRLQRIAILQAEMVEAASGPEPQLAREPIQDNHNST